MGVPLKVWVVCDAYDHEGYGAPLAVFSSEEPAREFASEVMKQGDPPDDVVVFEMTLDRKNHID